ncbi:MAG: lytic transglycosylase domain-containing protein [Endomicrobium sp.]|jgi:soluble lytic murein transglycosylase|nr:lytic transglycosylase domain-containing protein [Endomicrobium sp.]
MSKFIVWSVLILGLFFLVNVEHKIGLSDKNYYNEYIIQYSNKFGIDAQLVKSVIKKESNINPEVVSNKGAIGLMQIMPKTAHEIAVQLNVSDYSADKLKDPQLNIMFGTYYLRKLLDYYNNNLILALAAYNAGIGNVDMWRKEIPNIHINVEKIPFNETKNYVKSVIFIYKIHRFVSQIKL